MATPTPEAMAQHAKAVAQRLVGSIPDDYAAFVLKYAADYEGQMPTEDDFFSWLEGRDWGVSNG